MKRVLGLFLIVALLVVPDVAFAGVDEERDAAEARAYLERTDLTEIFTRKNEDYPFELVLPDWVSKGLTGMEIHEEIYRKVGIDLKEEVKLGRLYVKNGKYYINFKEKKIEKEIVKRQKRLYEIKLKTIDLEEAYKIDGLNIEKLGLKEIDDIKYLICLEDLFLSSNRNIKDYKALSYLLNLKHLSLDENNLTDISFVNYITTNIIALSLANNNIEDISVLTRFGELEWLFLSDNTITSLKALESLKKLEELSIDGNPVAIKDLKYIEELCYTQILRRLYIDRKVFNEYGMHFALYPEYLQWVDIIYFHEDDGSITEWYNY